ncbi:MAG: ATP-binding protein [Myxococcaceae bacterium]
MKRKAPVKKKATAKKSAPARRATHGPAKSHEAARLLHELQVHQIELQMQNEELQQARQELEVSLTDYTELFELAPAGCAIVAPDGTLQRVNRKAEQILEKPRNWLQGKSFHDLVSRGDRAVFSKLLLNAVAESRQEPVEFKLEGDGGKTLSARAVLLARENATLLISFEDVTLIRERERQLAETRQALEDADRRKDDFLSTLSHELRNPLAPIRNSLYVLDRASTPEHAARAKTVITRQVAHLSRLIDDLLDATRIGRGKVHLKRESLDFADLVRRVVDDHLMQFQQSGVLLESRFEGGPFWVDADPARLVQVVSNLLGNAVKFTPRDGEVVVTLRRDRDLLVLTVKDTGAGIEAKLLSSIFESFVQAPQTLDRSRGGLGLGLAMVKGFVELHGGTVAVASAGPGRGSEFTVELPAGAAPQPTEAVMAVGAGAVPRRVLLIEDNVDACTSMRDALELGGHQVEVAYDGRRGIEAAARFQPEVIFCDIGLPGMNGYAVARELRADAARKNTLLIALSGYGRPEDVQKATQAGFDAHLTKPPPFDEVEQLLSSAAATRPQAPKAKASAPPPRPSDAMIH